MMEERKNRKRNTEAKKREEKKIVSKKRGKTARKTKDGERKALNIRVDMKKKL